MWPPRDGKRETEGDSDGGDRDGAGGDKDIREASLCERYRERPWENWSHSVQTISIPQAWFRKPDHTLLLPEGSSIAACSFLG